MSDNPSQRVVEQRMRNRIMEVVETLAEGDEGVRQVGMYEYFEQFYDWYPHRDDEQNRSNGAITEIERNLLAATKTVLDDACDDDSYATDDAFIATGWPKRIQPFARAALDVMMLRGRFSEDQEELTPMSRP